MGKTAEDHYYAGIEASEEGRFADACEEYQKATEIKPDYADAWNGWGVVLHKQYTGISSEKENKLEDNNNILIEAIEKFQKATIINKKSANLVKHSNGIFGIGQYIGSTNLI